MLQSEPMRRFSTRLGSEAIRVGQAQGYQLEEILHLPPDTIARAGEGDEAAMRDLRRAALQGRQAHVGAQRPSMGQDMQKGRRTEIEFLNGLVVREGEKLGISCPANAALTDIVTARRARRTEAGSAAHHRTAAELRGVARMAYRLPARQPISQKSASSRVASLKIAINSASRAGVA